MTFGDIKNITTEDGWIYEVYSVYLSNGKAIYALTVNEIMQTVASSLLPVARKMAEARASRVSFYRNSKINLKNYGEYFFEQITEEARQSQDRVKVLSLITKGISVEDDRVVTIEIWREIMIFFYQDITLGSVNLVRD